MPILLLLLLLLLLFLWGCVKMLLGRWGPFRTPNFPAFHSKRIEKRVGSSLLLSWNHEQNLCPFLSLSSGGPAF